MTFDKGFEVHICRRRTTVSKRNKWITLFSLILCPCSQPLGEVSAKLMLCIWKTPRKWILGGVNCPTGRYGHASLKCWLVGRPRYSLLIHSGRALTILRAWGEKSLLRFMKALSVIVQHLIIVQGGMKLVFIPDTLLAMFRSGSNYWTWAGLITSEIFTKTGIEHKMYYANCCKIRYWLICGDWNKLQNSWKPEGGGQVNFFLEQQENMGGVMS